MMVRTKLWLVLATAMLLVLSACGGDDSGGTEAPDNGAVTTTASGDSETPSTTAAAGNGGSGEAPVTEMGSFSVNDTEFAVNFLNRCIPFGGDDGVTIDLQPLAPGAQMNLYGTADSLEVSVQGSAVQEMFGSIAFAADPFGDGEIRESSIDGDRWTGSATLLDSTGSDSTVELVWDVMIPEEVVDCSL